MTTKNFEDLFKTKSKRIFKNLTHYQFAETYEENLTDANSNYKDLINDLKTTETMKYIPGDSIKTHPNF